MKLTVLSTIAIGAGLCLMGTSFVWARAVSQQGTWTDEQAQELREAKDEAHALHYAYKGAVARGGTTVGHGEAPGHTHEGVEVPEDVTELKAKLDEVLARHDRMSVQLDTARKGSFSLAALFWWAGVGSSGLGVALHFICKTAWAREKLGED